jgi:hypothetical protein
MKYQVIKATQDSPEIIIYENAEGVYLFIPLDPENMDYQAFLAWVAEGNTPTEWTPEP